MANDESGIRQLSASERHMPSCPEDHAARSILREYDASFLRLFTYNLLWVAAVIACLACMFLMS